jgi:hypothetical protein
MKEPIHSKLKQSGLMSAIWLITLAGLTYLAAGNLRADDATTNATDAATSSGPTETETINWLKDHLDHFSFSRPLKYGRVFSGAIFHG